MAEIMVLVLFTLLLALAAALTSRDTQIAEQERKLTELRGLEEEVRELTDKNPAGISVSDIIQQITRQRETIAALKADVARLAEFESQGRALESIIQELKRNGVENPTPAAIAGKIQEAQRLVRENDNLRGQVSQMSRQIKVTGRGNEFPSCWTTIDGKTQSIFEIMIGPNGIELHDRNLPDRVDDKKALPLSSIRFTRWLSLEDFREQVSPLYRWSVVNGCRFYVIRFSSERNVRADLVNAIDAFFYPDSRIQIRPRQD